MKKTAIMILMVTCFAFSQAAAATDTDMDGVPDGAEKILKTDPLMSDTDGDGLSDLRDIHPLSVDVITFSAKGAKGFVISKLMVGDKDGSARPKKAPEDLEIMLKNVTGQDIKDFTVLYRITDLETKDAQSYLLPLKGFTLKKGETASVHIGKDEGGKHFRANPNSLFYLSANQRQVDVVVKAEGFQIQKKSVRKM